MNGAEAELPDYGLALKVMLVASFRREAGAARAARAWPAVVFHRFFHRKGP